MQSADQFQISATGNKRKLPEEGGNPILQVASKAPKLGVNSNSPNKFPYTKPTWYKSSGIVGSGKLGTEKPLNKGNGPMSQANFSIGNPVKDTLGFPTNYRVPYAKITRDYKYPIMDITQHHHLIITKRETKDPVQHRKGHESRRYTQLNLVAFNYLQALCEEMPATEQDVLTPDQVWNKWTVEGIVTSEEGQEEKDSKDEVGKERLINTVIKGYVYAFNLWKDKLNAGTKLWLVLKKVRVNGRFVLHPFGKDSTRDLPTQRSGTTPLPYQLIPWADWRYDQPTDEALVFYDEFGNKRRGKAIYIGRVEKGVTNMNKQLMRDICTNVSAVVSQPQVFVHLDC